MSKLISEFAAKYKDLTATIKAAQEKIKSDSQTLIGAIFNEFFAKHGEHVFAVHWTQGTPGFNDGDECLFSVHDIWLSITEESFEDGEGDYSPHHPELAEVFADFKVIQNLIKSIDNKYMQMIYDNDAKVVYFGPTGELEIQEWNCGY